MDAFGGHVPSHRFIGLLVFGSRIRIRQRTAVANGAATSVCSRRLGIIIDLFAAANNTTSINVDHDLACLRPTFRARQRPGD